MPVLLCEFVFYLLGTVYSVLVVVLFFQKRAAWPRCFVIQLVGTAVGIVACHIFALQIPAAAANTVEFSKSVFNAVVGGAIWIPYAFTSERVKATFRF
jgi:hypothetical protein